MRGGETSIPGYWRTGGGKYNLVGSAFHDCKHITGSQRPICPECSYNKRQVAEDQKLAETPSLSQASDNEMTALFCPALLANAGD